MNDWLHTIAIVSLIVAAVCALIIAVDIAAGHRQQMWIMNLVWPITALYSGPLGLWFKTNPVFWFMMQIAMLAGFLTSYPVNWWLLRKRIKEVM